MYNDLNDNVHFRNFNHLSFPSTELVLKPEHLKFLLRNQNDILDDILFETVNGKVVAFEGRSKFKSTTNFPNIFTVFEKVEDLKNGNKETVKECSSEELKSIGIDKFFYENLKLQNISETISYSDDGFTDYGAVNVERGVKRDFDGSFKKNNGNEIKNIFSITFEGYKKLYTANIELATFLTQRPERQPFNAVEIMNYIEQDKINVNFEGEGNVICLSSKGKTQKYDTNINIIDIFNHYLSDKNGVRPLEYVLQSEENAYNNLNMIKDHKIGFNYNEESGDFVFTNPVFEHEKLKFIEGIKEFEAECLDVDVEETQEKDKKLGFNMSFNPIENLLSVSKNNDFKSSISESIDQNLSKRKIIILKNNL